MRFLDLANVRPKIWLYREQRQKVLIFPETLYGKLFAVLNWGLNCWIPLHSKRDLEKCGYAATQTRRMQAVLQRTRRVLWWLRGYAATRLRRKLRVQALPENLESRLSQTEREGASSENFVFHSFAQRNTFLVFSFFPLTEIQLRQHKHNLTW